MQAGDAAQLQCIEAWRVLVLFHGMSHTAARDCVLQKLVAQDDAQVGMRWMPVPKPIPARPEPTSACVTPCCQARGAELLDADAKAEDIA